MDIVIFREELIEYLNESGVSQNELAKKAGVAQSQISNWVNGGGKRFGKNSRSVMEIIKNYRKSGETSISEDVAVAVREFCNGSNERSLILTQIIKSLTPLTV